MQVGLVTYQEFSWFSIVLFIYVFLSSFVGFVLYVSKQKWITYYALRRSKEATSLQVCRIA